MKNLNYLLIIILLGAFLSLYHIGTTMSFIGDQAWFYISARNALLSGNLPLLGITSSVTWLHQGPLWTYLLIPVLAIFNFNPIAPAFFTAFLSVLTIILLYILVRLWYGSRSALAASVIFAISPLVIIYSRMPYHTTPIPFFICLFLLSLSRREYYLASLFLGFLFQLELVTAILWPVCLYFLLRNRYSPRIRDLFAFLLGISPLLISGPIQTGGVFIWSLYHIFSNSGMVQSPLPFYLSLLDRFYLPGIPSLSWIIVLISCIYASSRRRIEIVWLIFPAILILLNGTASEAYFSLLLIPLSIFSGLLVSRIFPKNSLLIFFTAWWLINSHYLLSRNFQIAPQSYGPPLISRLTISRQILSQSTTVTPIIQIVGNGSQFKSTKDPYKYLVWWQGLSAKPGGTHLEFEINETTQTFRVLK